MLAQILMEKFRRSRRENVLQWKLNSKVPLSSETVSKILIRGVEPSVNTFIIMAYYLQMPTKEIADACRAAGDTVFCELLAPSPFDPKELELLRQFKALSDKSKKAVLDMVDALS